jgi:hypothetical protein
MHSNNLVVAIKADGQILRELDGKVLMPFGKEYDILIKNLGTTRCVVNIAIDGDDKTGSGLIIAAGQTITLERSIKDDNLEQGNRFKFIARTAAIEAHRGIKAEDGLINVKFEFEMPQHISLSPWTSSILRSSPGKMGAGTYDGTYQNHGSHSGPDAVLGGSYTTAQAQSMPTSQTYDCSTATTTSTGCIGSVAQPGITVPGSISDQKFVAATPLRGTGVKHSMTLQLLAVVGDIPVTKPITVKAKPECITCGKKNRATAKFCDQCGTSLTIV